MAGTKTTGQEAVSSVAVSRSSARPMAARASRSAVAGATTTRSAFWPIRTWATSGTSDHTSVVTGLPDSASKVAAPTKCRAPGVGTTRTSCPASVNARSTKAALYAATPPLTPSTIELTCLILPTRRRTRQLLPGASSENTPCPPPLASSRRDPAWGLVLAGGVGQQALVDLAQGDGEGLLLRGGIDQRADVLQQALGELAVVGVDLPRALGGEDDQPVLAAGALEQLVDRRGGGGPGGGRGPRHRGAGASIPGGGGRAAGGPGGRRRPAGAPPRAPAGG